MTIDAAAYPAPVAASGARGWTWPNGTPGYAYDILDLSRVRPSDLAEARAVASDDGIRPQSLRILNAMRFGPGDLTVIVGGVATDGSTCLGFVRPASGTAFFCPGFPGAKRLGPQAGFVVGRSRSYRLDGRTLHPLHLLGVTRGDVTSRATAAGPRSASRARTASSRRSD